MLFRSRQQKLLVQSSQPHGFDALESAVWRRTRQDDFGTGLQEHLSQAFNKDCSSIAVKVEKDSAKRTIVIWIDAASEKIADLITMIQNYINSTLCNLVYLEPVENSA